MQCDAVRRLEISTSEDGDSTAVIVFKDGSRALAYPCLDEDDISVSIRFKPAPQIHAFDVYHTLAADEVRVAFGETYEGSYPNA